MTKSSKPSPIPRSVWFAPLLVFVLVMTVTRIVFAQPMGQASDGETLFKEKCVACHTIGGGDLVGPDLAGVTERASNEWLANWLTAPDQMLAAGDPVATELFNKYNKIPMPNLGLTPDQVASLIAYLGAVRQRAAPRLDIPQGMRRAALT